MGNSVEIRGLGIGYGGKRLFAPFDLDIPQGSLNVVIGANGTGKSTLLQTVSGLLRPIEGKVEICGQDLSRLSPRKLSQLLSLVYTERGGGGGLTVRETVEMGRHPYTGILGRLGKEDRSIVERSLEEVGIAGKAERFLSEISDGERQKAMIARALAQETPVMMLDEPTNFLDVASRLEILGLIRKLVNEKGKTVLMSTHDTGSALERADNVITILPGDTRPVAIAPARGEEASRRLNAVFAERGVEYDSETRDFVIKN